MMLNQNVDKIPRGVGARFSATRIASSFDRFRSEREFNSVMEMLKAT